MLLMQGGPNTGETLALSTSHTTLGRHSDNAVVFDEALVSRRHAVNMETGAGFSIRDLGSTNGTYLNDERIGEDDRAIENGDVIRLGGGRTMRLSTVGPATTDVVVDTRARQVYVKGERLEPPLTRTQFDLLMLLESRKGEAVSRRSRIRCGRNDLRATSATTRSSNR